MQGEEGLALGSHKWAPPDCIFRGQVKLSRGLRLSRRRPEVKVQGTTAQRLKAVGMLWGSETPMHVFLLVLSLECRPELIV